MTREMKKLGIVMWLLVVAYYLYQYILRVSPSVMTDEIMAGFKLDAHGFGSLAAISTFFYAILQIPAGILSDLFGARRMVILSILMCTVGVALFAYTDSLYIVYLSRALIGSGSACAFVCVSKISSDWFPVEKKALLFALTVTIGTCGALIGGAPLTVMNTHFGWRDSFYLLAGLGVIILLLNVLFLRDRTTTEHKTSTLARQDTWNNIRDVFKSSFCWMYAIVAVGIYLSISVFADLWGVSFIMLKYELTKNVAAQAVSMIYVGTCFGVIIIAFLSSFFRDRRPLIGGSAIMIASLLTLLVFGDISSLWAIYAILFAIGFCAGGEVLCFSICCETMNISAAATVTGFINFIVTLGAAVVQKQIGQVLHMLWDGTLSDSGLPLYTVQDYQGAMSLVIISTLVSFILSFFLKRVPKHVAVEVI
ncbi:MFS transporter [Candidatus Paracaedibacter symbiosus]|uniref:MFS transporter n=1 Tax=Candidatus Paracaedibacter symbiosus TaxID=244582 RepID=UPI000509B750|nr:MFS transporter [Candidatus Paracaedibacter symbiosus]